MKRRTFTTKSLIQMRFAIARTHGFPDFPARVDRVGDQTSRWQARGLSDPDPQDRGSGH
jgi:hypothetical protein